MFLFQHPPNPYNKFNSNVSSYVRIFLLPSHVDIVSCRSLEISNIPGSINEATKVKAAVECIAFTCWGASSTAVFTFVASSKCYHAGISDVSALAWAHELGGLKSPMSCRTIQESTHHMKKEAKGKKGAAIATAATENCKWFAEESASLLNIWSVTTCFLFHTSNLQCTSTDVKARMWWTKTETETNCENRSNVCPVAMLEWYVATANLTPAV